MPHVVRKSGLNSFVKFLGEKGTTTTVSWFVDRDTGAVVIKIRPIRPWKKLPKPR